MTRMLASAAALLAFALAGCGPSGSPPPSQSAADSPAPGGQTSAPEEVGNNTYHIAAYGITVTAPEGWHVATDEDWKALEREVGMSQNESNALGWRGTIEAELLTAKNSSGWPEGEVLFGSDAYQFNAKPGGCRVFNGELNLQGNTAFWWTATTDGNEAWYRYIDASQTRIFRQHTYKGYGMSIRCVKNN